MDEFHDYIKKSLHFNVSTNHFVNIIGKEKTDKDRSFLKEKET